MTKVCGPVHADLRQGSSMNSGFGRGWSWLMAISCCNLVHSTLNKLGCYKHKHKCAIRFVDSLVRLQQRLRRVVYCQEGNSFYVVRRHRVGSSGGRSDSRRQRA